MGDAAAQGCYEQFVEPDRGPDMFMSSLVISANP
jgi:hypothetical protein